ncbi:transforming acidic coiled-coil-containing protein 3-like isoform X2 [Neodiprion fabricii]|uniref:transforming acidic coiled-coil-containing protein 3-like isoform X2 n=1 Tax=Neodiprion fabricii TaxID=2872261 RepID=UPI001ED8CE6D|nr:transforming acidic coiled-coil-containing protein 3-like isoform X2 [Neodiprion fabricii]
MSSRSPRSPRVDVTSPRPAFDSGSNAVLGSPNFCEREQKLEFETESPAKGGDCGDCGLRGREMALHIAGLEEKLSEETQATNRLALSVSEYEIQMSEKAREIEFLKLEIHEIQSERDGLKKQLEITSKHLDTIEISFNDVHEKYERAKQTIHILHQNVETLKNSLDERDVCISQKHEQYLKLKEHAMERMDFANSQLDLIERKYSLESSKLRAAVREAELGARSLSEQLEQRNKDNAELTSICDGLIERMDSQKNAGFDNQSIRPQSIQELCS